MASLSPDTLVGRKLKELRRRRNLSASDLAERCAQAGVPDLNRQVISNLETGRRRSVSIGEVLVLAYVLNVPPVVLFTPVGTADRVAVASDLTLGPAEALGWVCGETPIKDDADWQAGVHLLALARRLATIARGGASMTDIADLVADLSRAGIPAEEIPDVLKGGMEG